MLAQRFKAVELASLDNQWGIAKHMEEIGDSNVTTSGLSERRRAAKAEKEEMTYRKLTSQFSHSGAQGYRR